jgi:hypothetical protein
LCVETATRSFAISTAAGSPKDAGTVRGSWPSGPAMIGST